MLSQWNCLFVQLISTNENIKIELPGENKLFHNLRMVCFAQFQSRSSERTKWLFCRASCKGSVRQHLYQTFYLILFCNILILMQISVLHSFLIVMGNKAKSSAYYANTAIKLWPQPPYFITFYCCILLPDRSLPPLLAWHSMQFLQLFLKLLWKKTLSQKMTICIIIIG